MWEILEVLRRAHRGEKLKAVSRSTGRSRNTVKRYLAKAEELTLRAWLQGDTEDRHPLTLTKCNDLLSRRGVEVTYISLYFFAIKHCRF